MAQNEPLQNIEYPVLGDPNNVPKYIESAIKDLVQRSNMRFTTTTARNEAITSPIDGMESFTGIGANAVKEIRHNGTWVPIPIKLPARALAKTSAQSIPTSTATVLAGWGVLAGDDGNAGGIVHTSGENLVSFAGLYSIDASICYASASSGTGEAQLRVNGAQVVNGLTKFDGSITQVRVSTTLRLSAGDKVTLSAYQTSGAALNTHTGGGFTTFSMAMIGY